MYSERVERYGISLEQDTENVPNDGHYYVLANGDLVGRFKSLKKAQEAYRAYKASMDIQPLEVPKPSIAEAMRLEMERMSNRRLMWSDQEFAPPEGRKVPPPR